MVKWLDKLVTVKQSSSCKISNKLMFIEEIPALQNCLLSQFSSSICGACRENGYLIRKHVVKGKQHKKKRELQYKEP